MSRSSRFRDAINSGCEGIKPGWVRVNFNYFISEAVFDYILDAVHLVADSGWKLLPYYRFSVDTGLWRHRDQRLRADLGLDDVSFDSGRLEYEVRSLSEPEEAFKGYLEQAHRIIEAAEVEFGAEDTSAKLSEELERLRWFPLPTAPLIRLSSAAEVGAGRSVTRDDPST
jgi:hypothetical protein